MRRTPALIVGAGPAGCAAAIGLARAGVAHLMVERTRETGDALCGGFLSWRSLDTLAALGVTPDDLGGAPVTSARIFAGERVVEAALPHRAIGVSRHRLDGVLLARAIAAGSAVERGVSVKAFEGGVRFDDGGERPADAILLASGKHDIRGLARPAAARGRDPTLGLRVRARGAGVARLVGDTIELHCFDRGYAGIVMQEDGSANICLAVHRSRLAQAGDPVALLAVLGRELPALGDRLAFADRAIDAVANVPYGWRATQGRGGLFRLGDQAAVIPSLAGEGMGIALASGRSAAAALVRDGPAGAASWQHRFASDTRRPLAIAGITRRAMEYPVAARALLPLIGIAPGLIQIIARLTRIAHEPA